MKFCPECGSPLNGKEKCEYCTYDINTKKRDEVEENHLSTEPSFPNNGPFPNTQKIIDDYIKNNYIPLEKLKNNKLDCGKIKSITYSTTSPMMGGRHSVTLDFNNKKLEVIEQEFHFSPEIKKEYKVEEKDIDEIIKLIEENNFPAWSEIPINKLMVAFDAPVSYLSLYYENGNYSIPFTVVMDKEENKIFYDFREKVYLLANEERLTSKETLKEGNNNLFIMNQEYTGFCPECCRRMEKDAKKCECGYVKESEKSNN